VRFVSHYGAEASVMAKELPIYKEYLDLKDLIVKLGMNVDLNFY
jgi:hypothetical protein